MHLNLKLNKRIVLISEKKGQSRKSRVYKIMQTKGLLIKRSFNN